MSELQQDYDKAFNDMIGPLMTAVKENLTEEEMGTMTECGEKLKEQMKAPGIPVGTVAPEFTLSNAHGSKVTLSEEVKKGPVMLVFYRGAWCPVCSMHLKELNKLAPMLKEKYKAQIIAVTPQQPDVSKKQLEDMDVAINVCSDLEDSVMKSYNLLYTLDPKLNEVYLKLGIDVVATNGEGRMNLPVPATFIIDTKGTVIAMQADTDYTNRMKPDEILAGFDNDVAQGVTCGSCLK